MKYKFAFRVFPREGGCYFLAITEPEHVLHLRDKHNCLVVECTVKEAYTKASEIKSSILKHYNGLEVIPELVDFEQGDYIGEIKNLEMKIKYFERKLNGY